MSNKTSDKNVANIEEDVKILEEFAEICKAGLACYDQTREGKALEHILAEREQDKARIKELEEELRKYKSLDYIFKIQNEENYVDMKKIYFEWLDSIPKQVVIDKANEINKKYEDSKDENGESPYFYPDFTIRILQKLLEGEK